MNLSYQLIESNANGSIAEIRSTDTQELIASRIVKVLDGLTHRYESLYLNTADFCECAMEAEYKLGQHVVDNDDSEAFDRGLIVWHTLMFCALAA